MPFKDSYPQQSDPNQHLGEQQMPTVQQRLAAIANSLSGISAHHDTAGSVITALDAYPSVVDKVGEASVVQLHRITEQNKGFDSFAGNHALANKLETVFKGLDYSTVVDPAATAVATAHGLRTPLSPDDRLGKMQRDTADSKLKSAAGTFFVDYKQSVQKTAKIRLEAKAAENGPLPVTAEHEADAAQTGREDFDARISNRLDAIETALAGRKAQTVGRVALRKIRSKIDRDDYQADYDIRDAVRLLEHDIRVVESNAAVNHLASPESYDKLRQYAAEHGLSQLGKGEYDALIDAVLEELGPEVTVDRAQNHVKQLLETKTVPELRAFGLIQDVTKNQNRQDSPQGSRPYDPFEHLQDDVFRGFQDAFKAYGGANNFYENMFGSGPKAGTGSQGGYGQRSQQGSQRQHHDQQVSRGRQVSPEEAQVDTEIARMRAAGIDDSKIKVELLKKYLNPDGEYNEARAKVVSDRFRPKNSKTHFYGK